MKKRFQILSERWLKMVKSKYPECMEDIGFIVDEEFISSKHKHKLKCLLCGNILHAQPKAKMVHYKRTLRKGCPKCTDKARRLDGEVFVDTPMSEYNKKQHMLLTDFIKMKSVKGNVSLNVKSDYKCLICNEIYEYTAKHLIQRYKMYNSVGCPSCNNKRKRKPYIEEVRDKLKDYEILSDFGGWIQYCFYMGI